MESDPLVHAWQMYWSHRLHGTTNDYKAFEDTVRPLLQQVEGERDALAGENDRLWRFLADEAPIRELPEWMRDKIYARERAEQEAMASHE